MSLLSFVLNITMENKNKNISSSSSSSSSSSTTSTTTTKSNINTDTEDKDINRDRDRFRSNKCKTFLSTAQLSPQNYRDRLQRFIDAGADVDVRDKKTGRTALMLLARSPLLPSTLTVSLCKTLLVAGSANPLLKDDR